jgi:hypothetical protein
LDKATASKGKKVEKQQIAQEKPIQFGLRIDPEKIDELRGFLGEMHKDYSEKFADIQKRMKSFWADKSHYVLLEGMLETENMIYHNIWIVGYAIDYLEKRMSNVEAIVQGIADKLKVDLPSLKTEVETLHKTIKEPMFEEVFKFVQSVKESAEKSRHAGEEYVE